MARREKCLFCGGAADLLCDGYLGWGLVMDGTRRCCDINTPYTCDAPICRACVVISHPIHGSNWFDTIDHCPLCASDHPPGEMVKRIFDEPEQARIVREAHHARARNKYGRPLVIKQGGGQLPFSFD
ncbi:TPA: hypothetical protein ACOEOW_003860 [Enterobacter hormaechei subsp. xiangfangensis]